MFLVTGYKFSSLLVLTNFYRKTYQTYKVYSSYASNI